MRDCRSERGGFSTQSVLEVYPERYGFKFTSSSNYGQFKYNLYVKWKIRASRFLNTLQIYFPTIMRLSNVTNQTLRLGIDKNWLTLPHFM